MKLYSKIISTVIVSLFFTSAALAQSADTYSEKQGMENHHMMQGMGPHHSPWGHQGHQRHHRHMRMGNAAEHFLKMKNKLDLNQSQVDQLKTLRDAYRAENTINEAKLKLAKKELRELLLEDSINADKAEAKIKEINALEVPIRISSVKQLAKIKTIITKEQLKKLHKHSGHRKAD